MEASILVVILLVLSTVHAHRSTTPAQGQPQVPGSLGKYFVYVNCTDCDIDSDLVVKEAEGKNTTDSPGTIKTTETTETSETAETTETTETTETEETTEKSRTTKKSKKMPMRVGEVEKGKEKGGKCKGRGGLLKRPKPYVPKRPKVPKKPKVPKPCPPGQRRKPKRPTTRDYFNERTEQYVNPYLPKDKQGSGKDSGSKYSFRTEVYVNPQLPKGKQDSGSEYSYYEDPSAEDSWSGDSFYDDSNFKEIEPDYPMFEEVSPPIRTEEYVNPYLPEDKQDSGEGLLHEYSFTESPFKMDITEEYVNPYLPKDKQGSNKRYTLPFTARTEDYVNPHVSDIFSSEGSWLENLFSEFPSEKARTEEYVNPFLPKDTKDSSKGKGHTLPFTASSKKSRTGEYVNPFLSKDKQDSGDDYDDDENSDLQYFKKLIMKKYENSVFRYADLQGIPDENGMHENSVFCVYETVKEAGKIIETLDYSLRKPCKIVSSPANKVNLTTLYCRPYAKSRVCLMKVDCSPPSLVKSKANECDEQIIIRKQIIKDKKNSDGRSKRQDPGYKTKLGAMGVKINGATVTKK